MKSLAAAALAGGLLFGLSACTNPYDPGQRAIGGGLIGAGAGAAIGAAAGGGPGAATGALIGGGVGAITGAVTTPRPAYAYPRYRRRASYARCGYGRQWIAGHHNRYGRWVPGHCSRR